MNQQEFVYKWRAVTAADRKSEVQLYQEHLIDLCRLAGHPTPLEIDPGRTFFTVEEGVAKQGGGHGRADAWYKGHFAIEYKKPGGDLEAAYKQLLQYREALQNPPLLIVCDFHRLVIHTNFTDTAKQVMTLTLDDLLTPAGFHTVRNLFFNVPALRPDLTPAQVTEAAAARFGRLAAHLGKWGEEPQAVAHFLIRLLFCLFAEDIDLLPKGLFSRLVAEGKREPKAFNAKIRQLFGAMAQGSYFGEHNITWFNGGLFDDDRVIDLDADALLMVDEVTQLDWSAIEPAILGTLFTRSLDPQQRAKLGAQYTSKEDILLIVEPVLMAPLRREWEALQGRLHALAGRRDEAANKRERAGVAVQMSTLLGEFAAKIRGTRVLDPASGSGNFLYISLRLLLDLEKEVSNFAGAVGLQPFFPAVSPEQLYGIEVNDYAHELAQATVWIGYLQWLHENGYGFPGEPVLKALDNIRHMDAILQYDGEGRAVEPVWPAADVIVGNPPFLGVQRLRTELGNQYVTELFELYKGRVPGSADLVCYWFERAREQLERGKVRRAGLLATQSIRSTRNRGVLERIKSTGDIFMAWSDRPWVLDGAAVRVSIVCFDGDQEKQRTLDGAPVVQINADLTASTDYSIAQRLPENFGFGFEGIKKNGPFEITQAQAEALLAASADNKNGLPNSDVVKPWVNGHELMRRTERLWLIDFGINTPVEIATGYNQPFKYVEQVVKPVRMQSTDKQLRTYWWLFERPRPPMRAAIQKLSRYIVTPRVAKHRIFVWLDANIVPDGRLNVFTREDDYFFGVLQAKPHTLWAIKYAARHGVGNDPTYNNRISFETYPFPWPPGQEPQDDPRVLAIAEAARELVGLREGWLNPPDVFGAELNKRTLTNLYNARPEWLVAAHGRLDAAVCAAYGWPEGLGDEEVLGRLLGLNLERAGKVV